jgi:hypothetical protein
LACAALAVVATSTPIAVIASIAVAAATSPLVVARFGRIGIGRHLKWRLATAIPVIEIARGEISRAPVTHARLARLIGGMAAQVVAQPTRATRQLAPAAL